MSARGDQVTSAAIPGGPRALLGWYGACAAGTALCAGAVGLGAPGGLALAGGALGTALVLGGTAIASAAPGLQLFGPTICSVATGRPEVALTFDDGPDPSTTGRLLDALDAAGARATFFVLVDRAERDPGLLRAIAAGHEIALHGVTHHPWLTLRSPDAGARELADGARRLTDLCGAEIRWFRPPFGAVSPRLVAAVERAGLAQVWCSVRTGDGGRLPPDAVRARCARAGPGDIALLHDGRPSTADALPGILADLRARRLRPVTVGDLCASR